VAARRLGIPAVVTFDSGEFVGAADIGYGARSTLRQRLAVAAAARLARRRLVCSRHQHELARLAGIDADVIPFGSEPGVFIAPERRAEGPPWQLLNVANLNRVKDHDTLLRAMRQVIDRGLDVRLHIAGEDTLGGAAQSLARELGVAPRVLFHGSVPHPEVASLYQQAHLFVLSSRHEAAGVVLLEAALAGVPVVGSAVGFIADWHPDRALGIPPRDPAALAAAIADLLQDASRREQQARAARAWALEHDAGWTAARLLAIYEELSTVRGASAP
jgi:glycosyltransferase involved in cell wall biosynthesis